MPAHYIVIVKTEDGKWSMERKITGDFFSLSLLLYQLSQQFGLASEDFPKFVTGLGSGIGQSALDSSLPTDSSHAETS